MENVDFTDAPVYTGNNVVSMKNAAPEGTGLVAVEQSRAVAEIQAAIVAAKANPRNEETALTKIKKACKRTTLAEQAAYEYKRGGTQITGPSIRLAEVMANYWGNMEYGFREVSRGEGLSEVEAYAWDLETNTRVRRQFQLKHTRDTKYGSKAITAERDIYELMSNNAQRRVRACILEIIPGDIAEEAEKECDKTLVDDLKGFPIEAVAKKMVAVFEEVLVNKDMIEERLGHNLAAINAREIVRLKKIYASLKDGFGKREDFFKVDLWKSEPTKRKSEKKEQSKAAEQAPESTTSEPPNELDKALDGEAMPDTLDLFKALVAEAKINGLEYSALLRALRVKFGNERLNLSDLKPEDAPMVKAIISQEIDKLNA